jgi:multiple sugar transport system substrate-binding protein
MKRNVCLILSIALAIGFFAVECSAEDVTIRFWSDQSEPWQQKVIDAMTRDFEASHPGIKVETEYISWQDRQAKMTAALAAQDVPDVALLSSQYATSLPPEGALRPLDDVVKELGGPEAFSAASLSLARYKDKFYTVPYCTIPVVVFYRTDRLEEAGLKPPQTLEEFYNAVKVLSEKGKGKYFALGMPFGRTEWTDEAFGCMALWPIGGTVFDKNMKVAFNSPETVKALEYYKSLYPFTAPGSETWGYADTMKSYVSGSTAIVLYFGRILKNLEEYNPGILDKTGAILPPKGMYQRAVNPPQSIGVFAKSKHPEQGVEFLKFFLTGKDYLPFLWSTPGHAIPTVNARVEEWRQQELIKKYPQMIDVLLKACEADVGFSPTKPPGNPIPSPAWQTIRGSQIVPDAVQKVTLKNEDPKAVAEWAQKEIEKIVEKFKM